MVDGPYLRRLMLARGNLWALANHDEQKAHPNGQGGPGDISHQWQRRFVTLVQLMGKNRVGEEVEDSKGGEHAQRACGRVTVHRAITVRLNS